MAAAPEGRITHAVLGDRHVLRYSGRVNYTVAPALERFAERALAGVRADGLIFDLREAQLVDSTNLGLIARLGERLGRDDGHRCCIVSNNEDVTAVLRSMGFDSMFEIVADDPSLRASGPEEEIATPAPSRDELMRTMLDAHRLLARMDEKDRAHFRAVVEGLEAELHAR